MKRLVPVPMKEGREKVIVALLIRVHPLTPSTFSFSIQTNINENIFPSYVDNDKDDDDDEANAFQHYYFPIWTM